MSFCSHCGKQVEPNNLFCPSCGRKLVPEQFTQPNPGNSTRPVFNDGGSKDNLRKATQFVLFFILGLVILFFIALTMMDRISLVISATIGAILIFGAVVPLRSGRKGNTASVCIGCACATAIIGLFAITRGAALIGLFDIIVALPGYLAWKLVNKS